MVVLGFSLADCLWLSIAFLTGGTLACSAAYATNHFISDNSPEKTFWLVVFLACGLGTMVSFVLSGGMA